jgi:thiamine pyrophosphate-dependent acetolactate synthase large subunit-like protein
VGNVVSGLQQAYQSNSPVLFLGGGNGPETDYLPIIQPSYVRDLMRHITKFSMRCTEPWQIKQDVARAFKAQCTPDPYLFDAEGQLVYHGRLDDNWQDENSVTRQELREAVERLASCLPVAEEQHPSIGCSIKWRT